MPASRSARAITFAPRSWPSRPALAMTMRSGRSAMFDPIDAVAAAAQVQGFLELAHDAPQGAAHAIDLDVAAAAYAVLVPHLKAPRVPCSVRRRRPSPRRSRL